MRATGWLNPRSERMCYGRRETVQPSSWPTCRRQLTLFCRITKELVPIQQAILKMRKRAWRATEGGGKGERDVQGGFPSVPVDETATHGIQAGNRCHSGFSIASGSSSTRLRSSRWAPGSRVARWLNSGCSCSCWKKLWKLKPDCSSFSLEKDMMLGSAVVGEDGTTRGLREVSTRNKSEIL